MVNAEKPREIAVRTLLDARPESPFVEKRLAATLSGARLSTVDRAFCQQLVYGVIRHQSTLDWLIRRKTKPPESKPAVGILLRIGLFQIFWLDRVPNHAAVNETVELTRRFGCGRQRGLVNAVLRGYVREEESTRAALRALADTDPAIAWSHPAWLLARWRARWTRTECRALMNRNNRPPPTYARLNTLKTTAPQLLDRWKQEGVDAVPVSRDWLPAHLIWELRAHPAVDGLGTFRDGWFYIQDPSTLMACLALDVRPDGAESVLDLCAAPGGKTTFLAQLMQNRGRIVAEDNHRQRLARVRENCERLGVANVEVSMSGETGPAGDGEGFDRILVDAPCSNSGVLGRRVELRWRLKESEIDRLTRLQTGLLDRAATRLRPGGTLVYSTCSIEPEENIGVVERFLAGHADFRLVSQRTLLPFRDELDGAFAAVLKRDGKG